MTGRDENLAGGPARHVPVLLDEVLAVLAPKDGGIYVDGTFGAGGYSRAILDAANCTILAIERDGQALAAGQDMVRHYDGRLDLVPGRFSQLDTLLASRGLSAVDGVALDVGVSSMQLDDPQRGFSFRADGPLDMRMGKEGMSAADLVNGASEAELAWILRNLGEERRAGRVARAIVRARQEAPLTRTGELVAVIENVLGPKRAGAIHPATRSFQGLRIAVNHELEELALALAAAESVLKEGGRLAVVSFHSLEDRIVKRFFAQRSKPPANPSRHVPGLAAEKAALSFRSLLRSTVVPSEAELRRNPRARSARMRAAERTGAAPMPLDMAVLGVPVLQ